ncbi:MULTISPECIES: hypothetical protein [unclassified Oleiphilus]|nr:MULTISPECIES: hypothetical protein [unclassified Oleiphilus]KZY49337.1 hypothetical protein A3732_05435 [Oleiphilus sp. HI0050]KZY77837.1 hypothetical protein A3741_01140 [Oleiphilus sp. HI0069]KZY87676.1 hypothetical protein A3743_13795 [Oleiphilus sp. HI0072]KZY30885.1 hypothetical protein A3729_10020 [Oleiphilus sp. HI0043]KZY58587.1 hypothetical protein A3735_03295 [Oleiphilus sp. HI0061]
MPGLVKKTITVLVAASASIANATIDLSGLPGEFPHQEEVCASDLAREALRAESASQALNTPFIDMIKVGDELVWTRMGTQSPVLVPGDIVTLIGSNFGAGVDIDFSKIMLGNTRILETDLRMFDQKLAVSDQVNYETEQQVDAWDKNVISWQDDRIVFRVPDHASSGPLIVQVQKRTGYNESLLHPGSPHTVIDAQTSRIISDTFQHECDVVSQLSDAVASTPIDIDVNNPNFSDLVTEGRKIFWSYDYNIGVAHAVRNLDWKAIFNYRSFDPVKGGYADPRELFGAYKTVRGQVPNEAMDDVYFDPYPMPTPIPGFLTLGSAKLEGNTKDTGWVGYRYAEGNHPYTGPGEFAGFNCASCHGYQITYQNVNGEDETKVFPGLPNPEWTMKWTVLQTPLKTFKGIYEKEPGPDWAPEEEKVAKDMLIYHMPAGAGEHNLVRIKGEGSHTDNDYQFSPIAIPNVTNYMSIRRSLSHTESYVGFEGSYVHAEEPDGAQGAMRKAPLQALTAYMTQLDEDDDLLREIGMYRWLKQKGLLVDQTETGTVIETYTEMVPQPPKRGWFGIKIPQPDKEVTKTREIPALQEGQFISQGWQSYPKVSAAIARGKETFDRDCGSCHNDGVGANTNEKMLRLDEVGRFFSPTIYQKEVESIRATFLRDMYWVQNRGLLSDGHVRNMSDLVSPARCDSNSEMYQQYYTLHAPVRPAPGSVDQPITTPDLNRRGDVFRVPKSDYITRLDRGYKRNRFIEKHKYFSEVSWDDDHYYWDYQKMRREFGVDEMGTPGPVGLPATPHPWCTSNTEEVSDLVQYIMTL